MTKENQLFRPLFLISVLLLIVNDLYLKYEYHNYLTGKLSDFAGLFAFPYFLSYFLKKRIKLVYLLTGLHFIFWKSDISQPFFDYAQSIGIGINRTVDYMDLIALLILPLSYKYYTDSHFSIWHKFTRVLKPLVMAICIFSFIATTLNKEIGMINMRSELKADLQMDIEKAKELNILYESGQSRYTYWVKVPGKKASIATKIVIMEEYNGLAKIRLDSIINYQIEGFRINQKDIEYLNNLSQSQIEKLFVDQVRKQSEKK
ncbi:MAG: hypothetical protein ABJ092_14740 [Gillisia sp.]